MGVLIAVDEAAAGVSECLMDRRCGDRRKLKRVPLEERCARPPLCSSVLIDG